MREQVTSLAEFERLEWQVRAFWSTTHDGFYIVTAFGFPCFIYVKHIDCWLGAFNDMMPTYTWGKLRPLKPCRIVAATVLSDIYRRGMAGLVQHRLLGLDISKGAKI